MIQAETPLRQPKRTDRPWEDPWRRYDKQLERRRPPPPTPPKDGEDAPAPQPASKPTPANVPPRTGGPVLL